MKLQKAGKLNTGLINRPDSCILFLHLTCFSLMLLNELLFQFYVPACLLHFR